MSEENVLKMPEGVSSAGMVADLTDAYIKAVISLPEIMEDVADSMAIVALYCQRKGVAEGIMSDEDLEDDADKPN